MRKAHCVSGDHVTGTAAYCRRRRAVVGFVDADIAGGEALCRDVGRGCRSGVLQAVITGIGAAEGDAGDIHRLAQSNVLVGKRRALTEADHITLQHPARTAGHSRGRAGVIGLGIRNVADCQRPRGNVGAGGRRRRRQRVVGCIGVGQRNVADVDGFTGAGIFVGKGSTLAEAHAVAGDDVRRHAVHRGARGGVIDPVGGGVRHAQ